MRGFRGLYCGLLLLAIGGSGDALAACCVSTHVYVPPPHVVVPHTTYVPHTTTYVRPTVATVHPHTNLSSSPPPTVHPRHTPHVQTVTVVTTQPVSTRKRCAEKGQGGQGCKNQEEQTTWSRFRNWLHGEK
jgi:hypothetical protein